MLWLIIVLVAVSGLEVTAAPLDRAVTGRKTEKCRHNPLLCPPVKDAEDLWRMMPGDSKNADIVKKDMIGGDAKNADIVKKDMIGGDAKNAEDLWRMMPGDSKNADIVKKDMIGGDAKNADIVKKDMIGGDAKNDYWRNYCNGINPSWCSGPGRCESMECARYVNGLSPR